MVKLGLISKHIVLFEHNNENPRYPLCGIILIEDEFIVDIITVPNPSSLLELFQIYSEWNPIDYSDFYISPGIIDLNTRTEWDTLEILTKEAIIGGVTLVATESGNYYQQHYNGNLYCDVLKIQVINDTTCFENLNNSTSVIKGYLFPPSPQVKSITHLERIIRNSEITGLPLFIDANMPDQRLLYMSSPSRLENVEHRKSGEKKIHSIYASAIPHEDIGSSEDSFDSSSDILSPVIRTASLKQDENFFFKDSRSSLSPGKGPQDMRKLSLLMPNEENKSLDTVKDQKSLPTSIYDDLDLRIKNTIQNHDDLVQVEKSSYAMSGSTNYEPPKKTMSYSDLSNLSDNSPSIPSAPLSFASKLAMRAQSFLLKPLETKPENTDYKNDYTHHLANCPIHWETSGIKEILKVISPNTRIHFVGLSSSVSINTIRNERKNYKNLTCEISAMNLCFTSSCIQKGDTKFKNSPPIRNSANCNLLWELLKMKGIDAICSGHASIIPYKKLTKNFQTALNGISCIGCSLQSVWFMLNKPVSSNDQIEHYIVRLGKWLSMHPSQILNIYHKRGSISKGKLADLIVWAPRERVRLHQEYSYSETSPFMDHDMLGKIYSVYLRGKLAYNGNNVEAFGINIWK